MTPVFVLTLSDIIGLVCIGLLIAIFGGLVLWAKLDRWVRRQKATPEKPWTVDRDGRVKTEKDRPVQLKARGQQ